MVEEDSPFESPRLLLAGAQRHIATFEAKLDELCAPGTWANPESPNTGIEVVAGFRIPPEMKQIVFDLTQNLRSALDHAVFASAFMLTGYDGEGGTKFPFGDDAKEARGDANRRCKRVPPEMVEYLLAFGPHAGGNPIIYGLNKLRNTKSHRVLVPISATSRKVRTATVTKASTTFYAWQGLQDGIKKTVQETTFPPGTEATFFRLELLIGTGKFRGEPALAVFNSMLSEVERIVSGIEAETMRLLGTT